MPEFQVNEVMLTIEEVREIAQMLRFPSHFEASVARRMGLRLDARASHAEEQNATRARLVEMYPTTRGI